MNVLNDHNCFGKKEALLRYNQFIDQVQQRTGLQSRDKAVRITRATLGTLGERVYRSTLDDLAAQLPDKLKKLIKARAHPEMTPQDVERYSLGEFYNRVNARADLGTLETSEEAKAVISVLRDAVTAGEWADLRAELPEEYDQLLS